MFHLHFHRNLAVHMMDVRGMGGVVAALIGVFGIGTTIYFQQKESIKIKSQELELSRDQISTESRVLWLDNIKIQCFALNESIIKLTHLLQEEKSNCKPKLIKSMFSTFSALNNLKLYINLDEDNETKDVKINIYIDSMLDKLEKILGLSGEKQIDKSILQGKELATSLYNDFTSLTTNMRLFLKAEWTKIKIKI